MNTIQIAIDGPAGAGKSTIAKRLADILGFTYIDTGAMYRGITLEAMNRGIDLANEQEFDFIDTIEFSFDDEDLHMNGNDVSKEIRDTHVSNNVSLVSSHYMVRKALVAVQQQMAQKQDVVMDGRDIGYIVLPNATFKFFLTATIQERARRRYQENRKRGIIQDFETIYEEIKRRDYLDSNREHSPLKPAEDAIVIDTSSMTIDEVVENIIEIIERG